MKMSVKKSLFAVACLFLMSAVGCSVENEDKTKEAVEDAVSATKSTLEGVKDTAGEYVDGAADVVEEGVDVTKEKAGDIADSTAKAYDGTKDSVTGAADKVAKKAGSMVSGAGGEAAELKASAEKKAKNMRDKVAE